MRMLALLIVLGISACSTPTNNSHNVIQANPIQKSLLFGDFSQPVVTHRDCENLDNFLCFDVGTNHPFQVPETKEDFLSKLTKNTAGPFGVEGQWKNGPWVYLPYRRETKFYGLAGEFFWILTYHDHEKELKPVNVTVFSYEHGLLLNVPVKEIMGIDAPIIVSAPFIMTYQKE